MLAESALALQSEYSAARKLKSLPTLKMEDTSRTSKTSIAVHVFSDILLLAIKVIKLVSFHLYYRCCKTVCAIELKTTLIDDKLILLTIFITKLSLFERVAYSRAGLHS